MEYCLEKNKYRQYPRVKLGRTTYSGMIDSGHYRLLFTRNWTPKRIHARFLVECNYYPRNVAIKLVYKSYIGLNTIQLHLDILMDLPTYEWMWTCHGWQLRWESENSLSHRGSSNRSFAAQQKFICLKLWAAITDTNSTISFISNGSGDLGLAIIKFHC